MLKCTDLCKSFAHKTAVDHLSLQVSPGETFALLGSNGAGKTTAIKMILGLMPQDQGQVEIAPDVRVGYSPETPYFPPYLTGREVVLYYARLQKIEKKSRSAEVARVMQQTGLEDTKTKVAHYSKGMLQRLALSQALLGDPDLLLLDEPTAGLDALGRAEMIQLLQSMKAQGKTIVLNSHILHDVERICDRGLIMKGGQCLLHWDKNEDYNGKNLEEIFIDTVGGCGL